MTINRWKEQRRPLARTVDLPMLAVVLTMQVAGVVLVAYLASRI